MINAAAGTLSGTWDAADLIGGPTASDFQNILSGGTYIQVHTTEFNSSDAIPGPIAALRAQLRAPEPSSWCLWGLLGLAAAAYARRMRRPRGATA